VRITSAIGKQLYIQVLEFNEQQLQSTPLLFHAEDILGTKLIETKANLYTRKLSKINQVARDNR
jgi:hypothetical protein